jgi:predicted O-methyltransferase YrrM
MNSTNLLTPTDLLFFLLRDSGYRTYLELGISNGDNFSRMAKVLDAYGVDIVDNRREKCGNFFCMTTDDFFRDNEIMFDAIFIDASHNYHDVKRDLINSIRFLNYNGIIILHDSDPADKSLTSLDICGDAYRIHDDLMVMDDISFVTVPVTGTGLTFVKKKGERRSEKY